MEKRRLYPLWKIVLAVAGLHFAVGLCLLAAVVSFSMRPDAVIHERDALPRILWLSLNILNEPGLSLSLWMHTPYSWALLETLGNSLLWGLVLGYLFVSLAQKSGAARQGRRRR
jgi:hypothetical protein